MTQTSTAYRSNNDQTIKRADGAEFMIIQRNAGYADNDGRWVASLQPELFWSNIGTLRRRRAARFLGVFDTKSDALMAIIEADRGPEIDESVNSMGRSSS